LTTVTRLPETVIVVIVGARRRGMAALIIGDRSPSRVQTVSYLALGQPAIKNVTPLKRHCAYAAAVSNK
jgi:hypothetical protein